MEIYLSQRGVRSACPALAVMLGTVVPAISKCDGVKSPEMLSFSWVDHALRWWDFVPSPVIAVRISHVLLPEKLHLRPLSGTDALGDSLMSWDIITARLVLNRVNCTAVQDEIRELGNVGGILVVHSVFSAICGPIRGIPDCGIQRHRFRGELASHGLCSLNFSDGYIVHIKSTREKKVVRF